MSDMIERVAKALFYARERRRAEEFACACVGPPQGDTTGWCCCAKRNAEDDARAVLSELLTPSTAMLIAGVKAMRNDDLDVTEKELLLGWRAMISKAMEE